MVTSKQHKHSNTMLIRFTWFIIFSIFFVGFVFFGVLGVPAKTVLTDKKLFWQDLLK